MRLSAYFPSADVDVPLQTAWEIMVDYESWNPAFANAVVTNATGEPGAEGEVVDITQYDDAGELTAHFYAETVRKIDRWRLTWAVYPVEGDAYRNFGDFELLERPDGGTTFYIQYFAQTRTAEADLEAVRAGTQASLEALVQAFKTYCETR